MSDQEAAAPSEQERQYRRRTPTSHEHFVEGREYLPGADSRSTLFYPPYPIVFAEGSGCWLTDVDGNRLLDLTGNHTSLVLGYGHPGVLEAVRDQLARGTCFPGTTTPQVRLARLLRERVPSLERVRFTNSGTEAAMIAARVARAHTGRPAVAKVEGGYNGSWDGAMVSTHPPADQAGDPERPLSVPASEGLAPGSVESTVVLPFNDAAAATRVVEQRAAELAAVVVEPILGSAGMIPAEPDYLRALREVTARHGILLVFDEVISFRLAYGGAQERFGVSPDLTVLGKLIGGGFPLGAVGGRADVMALFDPSHGTPRVPHPGSYNANPVSLVAGATTLELLTKHEIQELDRRGDRLREQARATLADAGLPVRVTGLGSLFAIHPTSGEVRSYRDRMRSDADLGRRIFLGLFNEGVLIDPRGAGCLSTVVGDSEIDLFTAALRRVSAEIAAS